MYVCICVHMGANTLGIQKRAFSPPETVVTELQTIISYLIRVLRINLCKSRSFIFTEYQVFVLEIKPRASHFKHNTV